MLLGALAYSRRADLPFWGPNPEARMVKALLSIFDKEALEVCQAYYFYPAFPTSAGRDRGKRDRKEGREDRKTERKKERKEGRKEGRKG